VALSQARSAVEEVQAALNQVASQEETVALIGNAADKAMKNARLALKEANGLITAMEVRLTKAAKRLDEDSWKRVLLKHSTDAVGQKYPENLLKPGYYPGTDWPTHAHHIVEKVGGPAVATEVQESQQILRNYGIDPFYGKENLIWAPNRGHTDQMARDIHKALDELVKEGGTYEKVRKRIIEKLKEFGTAYRDGRKWPTKTN
jgi:hypothetical protein